MKAAEPDGGEGGIRTLGPPKGSTVFETARFSHSRTSPGRFYRNLRGFRKSLRPLLATEWLRIDR